VEIKGYKKILKSSVQRYFVKLIGEQRNTLPKLLSPEEDEMPGMPVSRKFSPTTTPKCR
jgi:hypothetical protein